MKTAVIASLIASAAAFAPAQQKVSSSALSAGFDKELGAQPPVRSTVVGCRAVTAIIYLSRRDSLL